MDERAAEPAEDPPDDESLDEDVGGWQPRSPRASVVDGEAEQGAGEATEGAHAVPELEQRARGPVVGSQQGEQMCEDQARNDGAQDRAGNLVLGDAHLARAAFGEPGAGEDAEHDEGAEGGDRVAAADRDLAELEVGDHAGGSTVPEASKERESTSRPHRIGGCALAVRTVDGTVGTLTGGCSD